LSASRYLVQFTASAELRGKLEQALDLLSHVFPNRDLAALVERAVDTLLSVELKRRRGAGRLRDSESRKLRALKNGSRWVPRDVADVVWERDGGQCAFVDSAGRRCSARRFITFEHRQPFGLGGPPTVENLCLFCSGHNAHTARQVFGEVRAARPKAVKSPRSKRPPTRVGDPASTVTSASTAAFESPKSTERTGPAEAVASAEASGIASASSNTMPAGSAFASDHRASSSPVELDLDERVLSALRQLGFSKRDATWAVSAVRDEEMKHDVGAILRAAVHVLTASSLR
jgi:hypothetical protein